MPQQPRDHVNLLKLCVGVDSVEQLVDWQARRRAETGSEVSVHVTRMWPKREAELLAGGSLYWVIRGEIMARQRIVALERVTGEDGIDRCAINLYADVVRTYPVARRPFQGWRYLLPADVPADMQDKGMCDEHLPHELAIALTEIGVK